MCHDSASVTGGVPGLIMRPMFVDRYGYAILITRIQYDGRLGRAGAQDIEALVRALFFVKEAPLGGPMEGTSGFAKDFTAGGPRDSNGRSLRDLDLQTRLFRHPLSY